LIEGGGRTAAGALEAGVVDEVLFFIAPILIGGQNAPTAFEGKGFGSVKKALQLKDVWVGRIGNDTVFNARIQQP
jgi:diaminohydroxyphosphoribosylaminopyrimidine deaminase/5-amino-6-(5-phosphoribosylamino)uracil reductase